MVLVMESDGSLTPSRSQDSFARNYNDGIGQGSAADDLAIFGERDGEPDDNQLAALSRPAPLPRADILTAIEANHAKMDEIDETSLAQVAAAHDVLDLSWLDDTRPPADQFAAFRALEAGEKAKLVAYATASTTQSCFARDRQRDSLMHAFEIEIMPDIRAHWTPNAALFNRFKKAWLLKILGEDLGLAQEAVTLASSSKKEIVAFCDKLFAEPFATLTDAQRAAVAAWCPPMMQTAGVVCDEAEPASESPEPDSEVAQAA